MSSEGVVRRSVALPNDLAVQLRATCPPIRFYGPLIALVSCAMRDTNTLLVAGEVLNF